MSDICVAAARVVAYLGDGTPHTDDAINLTWSPSFCAGLHEGPAPNARRDHRRYSLQVPPVPPSVVAAPVGASGVRPRRVMALLWRRVQLHPMARPAKMLWSAATVMGLPRPGAPVGRVPA
jgi:hypothetical protein